MDPTPRALVLAAAVAVALVFSPLAGAYTTNGHTWSRSPVPYVVNPVNLDLPESAVAPAVRGGADTWALQSSAAFSFEYTGSSSQTTTGNDGVNLVLFRNASNGATIATTYWWYNSSRIIDADIVFWDGAHRFFAGSSGCSGGFFIEDIAAHEFGHALGLGHSTSTSATMYASTSSCSTRNRTLDADDIAGVEALYPPAPGSQPPGAPSGLRLVIVRH